MSHFISFIKNYNGNVLCYSFCLSYKVESSFIVDREIING